MFLEWIMDDYCYYITCLTTSSWILNLQWREMLSRLSSLTQFKRSFTPICMRHNPTEHPVRVNVNHSRRLRRLLRLLIILAELPIALQREFQQRTVTLSTSAGAMRRGFVACLGWELDLTGLPSPS